MCLRTSSCFHSSRFDPACRTRRATETTDLHVAAAARRARLRPSERQQRRNNDLPHREHAHPSPHARTERFHGAGWCHRAESQPRQHDGAGCRVYERSAWIQSPEPRADDRRRIELGERPPAVGSRPGELHVGRASICSRPRTARTAHRNSRSTTNGRTSRRSPRRGALATRTLFASISASSVN